MTAIEYSIVRLRAQLEKTAKRRKLSPREEELWQTVNKLVDHYAAREAKTSRAAGG
jgi:FKBP-type peptidyl-prolyl cis-trans isomerase (trigger factor)